MKFVKSNAQTNTAGLYRYKIKLTSKGKRLKYKVLKQRGAHKRGLVETARNQSHVMGRHRVHPYFNPYATSISLRIFENHEFRTHFS